MSEACWAGKGPFQAWVFTLPGASGADDLDFIVPVPCGNISRMEPPTCILKTDKQGDTTILDLTGSKAGSVGKEPSARGYADRHGGSGSRGACFRGSW